MAAATVHRGPDAGGWKTVSTPRQVLHLGHNRLKITDLRDVANQPLATRDGRYWLLFNGAIYNFRQLRNQLSGTHSFRTESDTEVLLYWLVERGEAGLAELDGMYALAFYDCRTEQLLLTRDPWGMKPLYYFENEKWLIVASEIRAILASGLVEKRLALTQVAHYLRFKFAQPPGTFYQDIFELEPGSVYQTVPGKQLEKWLSPATRESEELLQAPDEKTVLTQLADALTRVTARHLEADVPAGLFLSGGVDSTLLLALSREAGLAGLPAFTIAYAGEDERRATPDHRFARPAARQYGAEYYPVVVGRELLENFWQWLPTLDQPIGDSAAWLTWLLAQEANKHVKVVLSGAGADELFGGYNRHWAFYQYLKKYQWFQYGGFLFHKAAAALPNQPGLRHWHKLGKQLSSSPGETFVNFTAHLPARLVREEFRLGGSEMSGANQEWPPRCYSENIPKFIEQNLRSALHYDQTHYLPGDVLAVTDRMTMRHGLETRLPYLSREVTQIAEGLPAAFRLRHGRKWLLKELLRQRDGAPFVGRRKAGFGLPFGYWLRTAAGKPMIELLRNQQSVVFDVLLPEEVAHMLRAHLSGKREYGSELWTVVVLAGWLEQEFGRGHSRGQSRSAIPALVTGSLEK